MFRGIFSYSHNICLSIAQVACLSRPVTIGACWGHTWIILSQKEHELSNRAGTDLEAPSLLANSYSARRYCALYHRRKDIIHLDYLYKNPASKVTFWIPRGQEFSVSLWAWGTIKVQATTDFTVTCLEHSCRGFMGSEVRKVSCSSILKGLRCNTKAFRLYSQRSTKWHTKLSSLLGFGMDSHSSSKNQSNAIKRADMPGKRPFQKPRSTFSQPWKLIWLAS